MAHPHFISQTQCCPSALCPLKLRPPLSAGSQQRDSPVLVDPVLLLHSNPVWMWVHMCMLCFLTLAKHWFLFLSAVSSAARHLYCFPMLSQRARSQNLSPFGCFLSNCFTFSHPSAQIVWAKLRNSGMSLHFSRETTPIQSRHNFSLSLRDGGWAGRGPRKNRCCDHPFLFWSCCIPCQTGSIHSDAPQDTGQKDGKWLTSPKA